MHHMIWYTSTCGIMAMGILYKLDSMVKRVCGCNAPKSGLDQSGRVTGNYPNIAN